MSSNEIATNEPTKTKISFEIEYVECYVALPVSFGQGNMNGIFDPATVAQQRRPKVWELYHLTEQDALQAGSMMLAFTQNRAFKVERVYVKVENYKEYLLDREEMDVIDDQDDPPRRSRSNR